MSCFRNSFGLGIGLRLKARLHEGWKRAKFCSQIVQWLCLGLCNLKGLFVKLRSYLTQIRVGFDSGVVKFKVWSIQVLRF